jgi:antitoxin (DNA-binding transcriptional repressor) of toxin-antitoxin stability system
MIIFDNMIPEDAMTEMTVTEFSRNMRTTLDRIEHGREEVILVRNNVQIARILPGSPRLNALQALGDVYSVLDNAWES